jgi:hypothetical protein
MLVGWIVLAVLTLLAAASSLGIALRAKPSGRAELAIAAMISFFAFVGGPVLVLGYANRLTAATLGWLSLLVSAGAFSVLFRRRSPNAQLRDWANAARAIALAPIDGLREAARARSVVFVGLVCSGGLVALAFLLTLLVPYASWDGFYYHEPIVGYAIQNHGFAMVDLPPKQPVQSINGYPRICEAVSLWFCVFTDKTLVELPNDLGAVGLIWCVYAIARRYTDRVTAMGWATVLFLMPATWSQLCASYIDAQVGFFLLAATYYATRPAYRVRDAMWATLAMALALESKTPALAWVPPIALVAYGRLLYAHVRSRPTATIGAVLGGGAFLAALPLHFLWRNWVAFKDPFWPITMDVPKLGIHWKGLVTMATMAPEPPLKQILDAMYGLPVAGAGDIVHRGYGYAVAWAILPVAIIAVPVVIATAAAEIFVLRRRGTATNLAWVLIPTIVGLRATPSLDIARYNLHLVGALIFATTWLVSRNSWGRAREGLVSVATVLSIIPLFWMNGWGWYWGAGDDMSVRLKHPLSSPHAYVDRPSFDLLAKQRSKEILAGDRVAYDDDIWFPGSLWNFEFSNRVEYIPFTTKEAYLARIERFDPRWVAVGDNGAARKALEETGRWELVGQLLSADACVVLRRKGFAVSAR